MNAEANEILARTVSAAASGMIPEAPVACSRCRDAGWEEVAPRQVRPCQCLVARLKLRALGPRFVGASFDRLEQDVAAVGRRPHPSLLRARDVMAARPGGSYLLTGPYGAWKTYLAACQFNALFEQGWQGLRFLHDADLFRSLRNAELGEGVAVLTAADIRSGAIRHLFVDDLGKQTVTAFVRRAYWEIFDAIFQSDGRVGTTITSNYGLQGLAYDGEGQEVYEPAMIRRIEHVCTVLPVQR